MPEHPSPGDKRPLITDESDDGGGKRLHTQECDDASGSRRNIADFDRDGRNDALDDPEDLQRSFLFAMRHFKDPETLTFEARFESPSVQNDNTFCPDVSPTSDDGHTAAFRLYRTTLHSMRERILPWVNGARSQSESRDSMVPLFHRVEKEITRIEGIKREIWFQMETERKVQKTISERQSPLVYDTSKFFRTRNIGNDISTACLISVVLLNVIGGLTRNECGFLLEALHIILSAACTFFGMIATRTTGDQDRQTLEWELEEVLRDLPKSIGSALSRLDIDPDLELFASCSACNATHAPSKDADGKRVYPDLCEECGTPLLRTKAYKQAPCLDCGARYMPELGADDSLNYPSRCSATVDGKICRGRIAAPQDRDWNTAERTFPLQRALAFLGRWFSLPGVEDACDAASSDPLPSENGTWYNFLHAAIARSFRWIDGSNFMKPSGTDCHLVFSLFVDWFNPFAKSGNKHCSIGAMYMACLNLPPSLRFKDENLYLVGLIPGPKEPSKHQINHFLRHLVDDLVTLWKGVFLTRTFKYPMGRIVRCALIPLVADLPANRKTAGFVSFGAHLFCSLCWLKKDEMCNFNRCTWRKRNSDEHRFLANCWRNAENEDEREAITDEFGIRWSELLRLEYWDPIRFQVVDSMHNLFLGIIKHHCNILWKMDLESKEKRQKITPHTVQEQIDFMEEAAEILRDGNRLSALLGFRKGYVARLATTNGVLIAGGQRESKDCIVGRLIEWRKTHDEVVFPVVPDGGDPELDGTAKIKEASVLGEAVLNETHDDMRRTILPSWMESPPRNIGSSSSGKLKADNWRTLCTVTFVITLVRLWANNNKKQDYDMLQNFLDLAIAVRTATYRSTSHERIRMYEKYILNYLGGMVRIYGQESVRPNHHMALHLIDCLFDFGPVHSWWTFAFERLNGKLSRMRTNKIMRSMPVSFMKTFSRGVNLLAYISHTTLPIMRKFKDLADKWFGKAMEDKDEMERRTMKRSLAARNDVLDDLDQWSEDLIFNDAKAECLDDDDYTKLVQAIQSISATSTTRFLSIKAQVGENEVGERVANVVERRATLVARQARYRASLETRRAKHKDCLVEYTTIGGGKAVGRISSIFLHRRLGITDAFVKIQRSGELAVQDIPFDAYRTFPDLGARLYYEDNQGEDLVPAGNIIGHIAYCPFADQGKMSKATFVAVSLSRD